MKLAGRCLAAVERPAGTPLVWDGKGRAGTLVEPGIYLYRLEAGSYRKQGKVVVFR